VPVINQLRRSRESVNSSDSGPTAIRTPSGVAVAPGVLASWLRNGREIRPGSGTATSSVSPDPYVPIEPRPMIPGRPGSPASVAGGTTGAKTLIAAARSGLVSPRILSGSAGVNRVSDGGGVRAEKSRKAVSSTGRGVSFP
jgi:hypothetical protein